MTLDKQKLEAALSKIDELGEVAYLFEIGATDTIKSALRFTLAAMDEPSDEVTQAGIRSYNASGRFALGAHFKAMIAALVAQVKGE